MITVIEGQVRGKEKIERRRREWIADIATWTVGCLERRDERREEEGCRWAGNALWPKNVSISLLVVCWYLIKVILFIEMWLYLCRGIEGAVMAPGARKWGTKIEKIPQMWDLTEGIGKVSQGIQIWARNGAYRGSCSGRQIDSLRQWSITIHLNYITISHSNSTLGMILKCWLHSNFSATGNGIPTFLFIIPTHPNPEKIKYKWDITMFNII